LRATIFAFSLSFPVRCVAKLTNKPNCWICGAPANSAEHRIKRSDLTRFYGKGSYNGPSAPVHVRNGVTSPIQGPNSLRLKYEQSLCHDCNTSRTQPFDKAYDHFIEWVMSNEPVVLQKRHLNFEDIYGVDWREKQRDLFKYWVKSFGCRLVDAGQMVPRDLIDLLPQDSFRTALKMTFAVNEDVLLMPKQSREGFISKGELFSSNAKGYLWCESVSWFRIHYWYFSQPDGALGSTWIADAQYVYLGSEAPLPPEMRADFLAKLRLED
jgi:hypothetical protein